jgi:hypothetical protein
VGSKCFRATLVDYQLGSLDQRSVCWNAVCQHRRGFTGVLESAPERLHIDGSLEHEERVSVIVGVELLAICAKVLGTERTAVPFADDTPHMPVAESKGMCEVTKISCFDADERTRTHETSEQGHVTYLQGHLVCPQKGCLVRVQRDLDIYKEK